MAPQRTENSTRRSGGFTLAELMVVVVIIGVTAGMVIPYASSAADSAAMAAARMIVSDLQYAQNAAITTQSPVTVTFSSAGESYTVSNASGPLIHPINKTAYVTDFSSQRGFEGIDIVSVNFNGTAAVTFDELGSPDNTGTVTMQAGAQVYVITVAAGTGKVTVAASE